MAELLIAIILSCFTGAILNSKFVGSPKLDGFFKFVAKKLF